MGQAQNHIQQTGRGNPLLRIIFGPEVASELQEHEPRSRVPIRVAAREKVSLLLQFLWSQSESDVEIVPARHGGGDTMWRCDDAVVMVRRARSDPDSVSPSSLMDHRQS
ncbi:hypothetical protein E2542_SST00062 [Spatholobus suberectus]|nr:hypothetical protein E2542_SST00062 [Spatholobus suberectus]